MSETQLGDTLHHLRTGESIEATITDVSPIANFSHGFSDSPFMYEKPVLYLHLETEYGEIQLEIPFRNMESPMIRDFMTMPFDDIEHIDISTFVGNDVYLHLVDEDWVSFGWTKNPQIYDDTVLYRDSNFRKTNFPEDAVDQISLESRTHQYMSQLIQRDVLRQARGTNGWMEVPFVYDVYDGINVFVAQFYNKNVYFPFDNRITTAPDVEKFLSHLGIEYTPSEFDNETVWIKPIRDLHYTNRPDNDDLLCAEEMWTIAPEPYDDSQHTTLGEQIKEFFSFPNNEGLSVETSNEVARKAQSSVLHDVIFENMDVQTQESTKFN